MKKMFAILVVLMFAFTAPVFAASTASNVIGGTGAYSNSGGTLATGYNVSGNGSYEGTANAGGFLSLTLGVGSGQSTGSGSATQGVNLANSNATDQSHSSAFESAFGIGGPAESTTTRAYGQASQNDWALVSHPGGSSASGGNGNIAGYNANSSSSGPLLSISTANGNANVTGSTNVGAFQTSNSSVGFGVTQNSGTANANGNGLLQTQVLGSGNMSTGAYVAQGPSDAGARTTATFEYNNSGAGSASGSGIAGGLSVGHITNLPNGVQATSFAVSGASAH